MCRFAQRLRPFQVTDPSGKTLLSTDAIECGKLQIHDGVIVAAYQTATGGHGTIDDGPYEL